MNLLKSEGIFLQLLIIVLILFVSSCKSSYNTTYMKPFLIDKRGSRAAKKLHKKIHFLSESGFGIGHQDDLAYGIDWTYDGDQNNKSSDVKSISGSLPAVFGFDIGGLETDDSVNLDGIHFDHMRDLMVDVYKMGGVVTVSWHADNPVTNGNSWDTTRAVPMILNDPIIKEKFETWMEKLAAFLKTVKYKSKPIPIVFRPWHEMNGHWFWWGDPNCNPENYTALWQKTVELLRDKHKLHNLLYTYSPNQIENRDDYLKYYPGDDFVDMLGIDMYDFYNRDTYFDGLKVNLAVLKSIGEEKNKQYAFTETGLERIEKVSWFNDLYSVIEDTGIAWVLFWRNANKKHHYVPYSGHVAEEDFRLFTEEPKSLLLKDLRNLKH